MREKSRVALVQGQERYQNIAQALKLIQGDIQLEDRHRILIKPNFVTVSNQLAATHVDAVRALLDFLQEQGVSKVTIAEGPAIGSAEAGFQNYGYLSLAKDYHVEFLDLNLDEGVRIQLHDQNLHPMHLRVAKTVLDSDFRISIGPPKTHDTVIVTLSLKNIAMGSLVGGDKSALHQGYPATNLNLYTLAKYIAPNLSIIDGYQAMQGDGPTHGEPVDLRLAIASTDFLAADAVATTIMGFQLSEIGYLAHCHQGGLGEGDRERMEIVGNVTLKECIRPFKPHQSYPQQLAWKIPEVERLL